MKIEKFQISNKISNLFAADIVLELCTLQKDLANIYFVEILNANDNTPIIGLINYIDNIYEVMNFNSLINLSITFKVHITSARTDQISNYVNVISSCCHIINHGLCMHGSTRKGKETVKGGIKVLI